MRQADKEGAMRPGLVLLAVAVTAVAGVGCSSAQRAPDASAVADRFHAALERSDGAAACRQLAPETKSKLEQEEQAPCEQAILELDLPAGATAVNASVYVTTASVLLGQGGRTFLDEFEDGWRVSAAGCVSTAPDRPYDCELEG
jgi:hypothetical protein